MGRCLLKSFDKRIGEREIELKLGAIAFNDGDLVYVDEDVITFYIEIYSINI